MNPVRERNRFVEGEARGEEGSLVEEVNQIANSYSRERRKGLCEIRSLSSIKALNDWLIELDLYELPHAQLVE